ncbi:MAG: DUF2283 domain-containing protein [Candidatus ainarchaeum sp.]|nr:DUF2283 domain-containing protein [Candidatus ainarchaeum sp.]
MKGSKFTYDKISDAAYIYLHEPGGDSIARTVEIKSDIIIDFNAENKIIGIEILNASKNLGRESLKTAEAIAQTK